MLDPRKILDEIQTHKDTVLRRRGHLHVAEVAAYHSEEDRAAIMAWGYERALDALVKLRNFAAKEDWFDLGNGESVKLGPSDMAICPFCLVHASDCCACEYGRHHGICCYQDSDYMKLVGSGGAGLKTIIDHVSLPKILKIIADGMEEGEE